MSQDKLSRADHTHAAADKPSREDSDFLRSMTETLWNLQLIKARTRNTTVNEIAHNRPGIKKIFNGAVIQVPGVYSSIKLEDIKIK